MRSSCTLHIVASIQSDRFLIYVIAHSIGFMNECLEIAHASVNKSYVRYVIKSLA